MTGTGTTARVWAPAAEEVVLVLPTGGADGAERRVPLRRAAHGAPVPGGVQDGAAGAGGASDVGARPGWWESSEPLPPGTDYAFSIDGSPGRPDPRSPWQPQGVHGPSRTFDASAFDWTDEGYPGREVLGGVIYELHLGTFTPEGTLDAAIGRLGHLVDLGVTLVELMPVAAFPGRHGWGYDGVGLYAVHEPYGGPAALQRFVDAAHAAGLGVVLDVVYNHLGPSGNYLDLFGPYFSDRHSTPWGSGINLDAEHSAEVRRWICDNALRWLADFHLDALRLDAVHALVDDSPTHILSQLSQEVAELSRRLGRPLGLIAESDENQPRTVLPVEQVDAQGTPGRGMTAQWADDVHHAVHALLTGERHGYYVDFGTVEVLRTALTGAFVHAGSFSTFRERVWGAPVPPGTDGRRFVAFVSDHDQVGNRALGDRPGERVDTGGLAIAAALVLTSAFTPMVFMGEEWGASTPWQFFTDHEDPELAQAVREGRAREFGDHGWTVLYGGDITVPDPQSSSTRDASVLDWREPEHGDHARLLAWYRDLIAVRGRTPDLADGDLDAVRVHGSEGDPVIVVERRSVRVAINLGDEPVRVPSTVLVGDARGATGSDRPRVLAAWDAATEFADNGTLSLPARSCAVLAVDTLR